MKAHLSVCVIVTVLMQWSDLSTAYAQIGMQANAGLREEMFLPAPRSLQRLLSEGRTAIQEGRYADGISSLGAILQDDTDAIPEDLRGQDFFLRRGREVAPNNRGRADQAASPRFSSIKSEAIKELNRLPDEGRRALEIQFGVKARQLLDEAIAKRDFEAISTVARRYVHTEAGYDAMLLIAQAKITNGYPLAAADILQMLLDYPAARERYGVGLVESAAVCWLQAGNRSRAVSTIKLASRDFPNQSLTLHGQQIAIENWDGIVKAMEPEQRERNIDRSTNAWLVTGGTAARNATSELGMPLPNERWSWAIHSSRPEGAALQQAEENQRKLGRQLLPKIELRMLGNTVISRSNDSTIIGLDFESGLLKWQRTTPASVAPLKGNAWENGDNDISEELKNRIWGSNSFGRISCDSQRCYHIVQKQGEVETVRGFGMGMRNSSSTRLEGLSIAGEGEILWSLGGTDSDEPDLVSAYFLGPPLPYAGQLFTLIEINGQIELAVLEPETGKLQWRQQLAAASLQIEIDQGRQSHGLTPSISDGVIVCPTGIGGVVALDLLTRSLRWGGTYLPNLSRSSMGMGMGGGAFGGSDYDPLDSRWADESLIIENGIVAFTPQDSELVLCYDLLTGDELLRRQRANGCFAVGINGQDLIVVNSRSVQALDIASRGSVRWEVQFPELHVLAGKGIWEEGKLLLPLTGNKVIQVDLKQGQIVDSAVVSQPLGNIFAHKGVLLSVAPTAITAYYTRQQLKSAVDERLAKDPKDTWGLNYQSQLLLAEGKVTDAFRLLLDSYAIDPEDFETRFFLVDAMLVGLQQDFNYFSQYADQLDLIVVPSTPQRLRYLQLLAKGLVEQGNHFGAFKRLWDIMLERQDAVVSGAQMRNNRIQLAADHSADLDAWFAVELGRTYEKCNAQQQAEIRQWVTDVFAKLKTTVITVRRQVLRHMVHLPAAEQENLELAKSLLKYNEQTGAEQILMHLANSPNSSVREEAHRLLHELPEADLALLRSKSLTDVLWPEGMLARQLDETADAIYPIGRPIEVIGQRFGRPVVNLTVSDRLVLSDVNGKTIYHLAYRPATADSPVSHLHTDMRGGLMLLESSSELIGIDYYRGRDPNQALLWRFSLDSAAPREPFRGGAVFESPPSQPLGIQRINRSKLGDRPHVEVGPLLASTKIVQSSGSIVGLDPYSGRKLWTRDGYGKDIRFAGNRQGNVLCVVSPARAKTEFIDARDGKLIKLSKYLVDEMSQRWNDKTKNHWEQWFSFENWIVDYVDEDAGKVRLRVWNPLEEKILFESQLPDNVRVAQCQRSTIAVLNPTGQLQLIDLASEQVHKFDVPVDDELIQIGLLKFADRLVIVTNNDRSILNTSTNNSLQANGFVYCFNSQKNQLEWATPGRLYNMTIPLVQPRNSPLMAVYRTNSTLENMPSLLGLLDLRSGKIVYAFEGMRIERSAAFSMEIRPQTQEIAIMINEKYFRFKVTDQPPPPEPIAHFGSAYQHAENSQIKRDNSNIFDP